MNIFKVIQNYLHLKKDILNGNTRLSPVITDGDNILLLKRTRTPVEENINWSNLLSDYIEKSIIIYIKWLKKGKPEQIRLIFHKENFFDDLEPQIILYYPNNTVFLDYNQLRYGHLIKREVETQKQCVRAAESDYIEFRTSVLNDKEIEAVFFEVAKKVKKSIKTKVDYQFVD